MSIIAGTGHYLEMTKKPRVLNLKVVIVIRKQIMQASESLFLKCNMYKNFHFFFIIILCVCVSVCFLLSYQSTNTLSFVNRL